MRQQIRRIVVLCFLSLSIAGLFACASRFDRHHTPIRKASAAPIASVRTVQHSLGQIQVPIDPQRIVTPSPCTLEPALALGAQPIGGSHWNWQQPYLQNKLMGIADAGWIPDVNLEKLAALQPDLIVGTSYQAYLYGLLSQIAPTFLAEERPEGSSDWKAVLYQVAEALGKTEAADRILQNYYARLERFKAEMGDRLQQQISVVALYQGQLNSYTQTDFSGTILQDAGLSRPPLQRRDRTLLSSGSSAISKERLFDIDGDVMFLVRNDANEADRHIKLAQLKADPLWSQLNAVRRESVYEVPDYWLSCSPLAADAVIDDLFKYLLPRK